MTQAERIKGASHCLRGRLAHSRDLLTRDSLRLRRGILRNTILAVLGTATLLALAACGNKIPPAGTDLGQGDMCKFDFLRDIEVQKGVNITNHELRAACKASCEPADPTQCKFWQTDPFQCGQLTYANGVWTPTEFALPAFWLKDAGGNKILDECRGSVFMAPLGGQTHDGDYQFTIDRFALNGGGVQGSGDDGMKQIPFPAEGGGTITDSPHIEVPWCRWYGAPVTIQADAAHEPVDFCAFRPNPGGRISVVGDWVVDDAWTEIHEARMLVAVRPDQSGGNCSREECLDHQFGCLLDDQEGRGTPPVTCEDPTTPGCQHPDTWHLLTSGNFVKDTAQQDELDIVVPIPPARDPANTKLVWTVPEMEGGCFITGVTCNIACDANAPNGPSCQIQLLRNGVDAALSDHSCATDVCPCTNGHQNCNLLTGGPQDKCFVPDEAGGWTWEHSPPLGLDWDACNPSGVFGPTHIAFARDIRVEWVPSTQDQPTGLACGGSIVPRLLTVTAQNAPAVDESAPAAVQVAEADAGDTAVEQDGLWGCRCSFQDPAQPGATFEAGVLGCAPPELEGDRLDDIHEACASVCAGEALIGQGAPAARIGPSLPAADAVGHLQIENACPGPALTNRVSSVADYTASLDDSRSFVRVGDVDSQGHFSEQARSPLGGLVAFDVTDSTHLELATVQAAPQDFVIGSFLNLSSIEVQRAFSIGLNRAVAQKQADGTFSLPVEQLTLATRASINDVDTTSLFTNESPFRLTWDPSRDVLTMDGQGDDGAGHGVQFHMEAHTTNHPPHAVAADQVVECQSPSGAPVRLDASRSADPDPGDALTHFQWFENAVGLSIAPTVTVQAALGQHAYDVHVYDAVLASAMAVAQVNVVDTTAPVVSCAVATPVLLQPFPPDHTLVNVGLSATASDVCSGARPVTVKVFGTEDDQTPTGDTTTVFSPDAANIAAGTLRLRDERVASGPGRVYLIVPQATDPSGNKGFACCTVAVPHAKAADSVAAVQAQAAAAQTFCLNNNGAAPSGYVVIGAGPVIGPKQ